MPRVRAARRYEFHTEFDAPLPFVFRWCTDYSPKDPVLGQDPKVRRILRRERDRVVFEDLYDEPDGWMWSRTTVRLLPPARWHADVLGSHRTWRLDYDLRSLEGGRTEFRLVGWRRPTPLGARNPPARDFQREMEEEWGHFREALERDYREERSGRRPKSRRSLKN